MSSNIIDKQLKQIQHADLTNYNPETNTYTIRKKTGIKIKEDKGYLIKLKESAFTNTTIINNWNNGSFPDILYLKIDVNKKMNNMIRIVGVGYDPVTRQDLQKYWSGWLSLDNIDIIAEL